jgi:hypothetical protein
MELPILHGTERQVKRAEKRRNSYLRKWQEHLKNAKDAGADDKHIAAIEEVIEYASRQTSALYWNTIPTGNTMYPRPEMAEIDRNLYDLSIKCRLEWTKMHGHTPWFLSPEILDPKSRDRQGNNEVNQGTSAPSTGPGA